MQKKEHDDKRRVARCSGCQFISPQEYQPYPRLWPYIVCTACGERITEVTTCPCGSGRRER